MERCAARDVEGTPSSKDMSELSGHKRKQRDAMEVDQHDPACKSGGVNGRHATRASSDKLASALNLARGYFKGTHMPVDGWFQPCK